jgi:ATP-dependent RNA helicase HelY
MGNRLIDTFVQSNNATVVNPELVRIAREDERVLRVTDRRRGRPPRFRGPSRVDVIERLDAEALLPAIVFIFSRAGCDAAVDQCLRSGLRLNTPAEAAEVRHTVEERCATIPDSDLGVLGYHAWLEGLMRGVAAHHAGLLPTFKEVVEDLFSRGLVKAVFATETLALGINMPARTVVLERLVKWNGEQHADITPGEYTQLTGRAGRRGIDVEGHAVVVWTPELDPVAVAGLASTRTYPLRSSFRPSYNMAVNLVRQFGRERARVLLESSFAQFQADQAVVGLARQVRRNNEALEGYLASMSCHLGDFTEYAGLRRQLSNREAEMSRQRSAARRAAAAASLEKLGIGDVIQVPAGRRAGLAIVLDPGLPGGVEGARPVVLTADRQVKRLSVVDFPTPVEALTRIRIPKSFNPRSPQSRRDLASTLRAQGIEGTPRRSSRGESVEDPEIARLRAELRRHPCHGCTDREEHARWGERYWRLRQDTEALERRIANRTSSIARTFDRVCDVLTTLRYLDGEVVTSDGARLARIYGELDLLVAECLRAALWDNLTPAELAACVAALVYEGRQGEGGPPPVPGGRVRRVLTDMLELWSDLDAVEQDNKVDFLREPDLGFTLAAFQWASGKSLDAVLTESDFSAGDFVRWVRQVLDLLSQIAEVVDAPTHVRTTARTAMDALRRGVVAYSSVG